MSWRWTNVVLTSGDVVTANEVRDGVAQIVGEFNGRLDRDNVGALAVTAAKLALRAMHDIDGNENLVPISVVKSQGYVELLSRTVTLPTDAVLHVRAGASIIGARGSAICEPPLLLIAVDGVIVGTMRAPLLQSAAGLFTTYTSVWLTAQAPCAAGQHVVSFFLDEQDENAFTVDERQLHVEEVFR